MIMHYVQQEMDTLMDDDAFGMLVVDDGGPLMKDFMKVIKERIGQSSSTWDTRWLTHHETPSWNTIMVWLGDEMTAISHQVSFAYISTTYRWWW